MNWQYNEWQGDERFDDKEHAKIEALRAIAEQLAEMNASADRDFIQTQLYKEA